MSWASIGTVALGSDRAAARLGFGGAWLTGPGTYGPPPDLDAARRVVRTAVERGVQLVDTADCYGPETSELLIAEALHPYPDGVVVSTKGGRLALGDNRWQADGRPEHLRAACEGSLRRLRLERIELYQLNAIDPAVPVDESLGALVELQAEGKVGAIGVCNVTVEELEQARAVTSITSVQDRYDLLTRENDAVLDACEKAGIAFLPWFPPPNEHRVGPGSALARAADAHAATPAQVMLAWLVHRSPVTVPLPGTYVPAWLDENLAVVNLELSAGEMRELTEWEVPR